MNVLIAGPQNTGQSEILEALGCEIPNSLQGACLKKRFATEYFTEEVGIWVDVIEDYETWVNEFTSKDAEEIRDTLILFIYTCSEPDASIKEFVECLGATSVCVAPASNAQKFESFGLDMVPLERLTDAIHTAIGDKLASNDSGLTVCTELFDNDTNIDQLAAQLRHARESKTMSITEKQALVQRIARILIS